MKVEIVDSASGSATLEVSGSGSLAAFENESGKHVVQRCPPTERGSRRHTSTVSVGVLPVLNIQVVKIKEDDIEIITQRGHGPGGQHQNKTDSAVRMKHIPTGISVFINGRDQHQNRTTARRILSGRVQDHYYSLQNAEYATKRKSLLGDRGRGGARRTYNIFKGFVVDHVLGTRTNDVKAIMKGNLDLLR